MKTKSSVSKENYPLITLSSKELEKAIDQLHHFIEKGKKAETLPTFQKTVAFARGFKKLVTHSLSPKKQKKKKNANFQAKCSLQSSIDLIRIYSSVLANLQQGNAEEQVLAAKVRAVVVSYNDLVRKNKQTEHTLGKKISRFFLNSAGYHLDPEIFSSEIFLPEAFDASSKKVSLFPQNATSQKIQSFVQLPKDASEEDRDCVNKQERELFLAKAFTLIKQQTTIPIVSEEELLKTLREAKIFSSFLKTDDAFSVFVSMQISLFPGEQFEVLGEFERKRDSAFPSIPVQENFHMGAHASQTGFPRISQGVFPMSEKLVPRALLRLQFLPHLEALLQMKSNLAEKLLPKGLYNFHAKKLFKVRRTVFQTYKEHLLPLLHKLSATLYAAAFGKDDEGAKKTIQTFFSFLQTKYNYFEEYCIIHEEIQHHFVYQPIEALQKKLLFAPTTSDKKELPLECETFIDDEIEKKREELYVKLATSTDEEKITLFYQLLMGSVFHKATVEIALLLMSEQFGYDAKRLQDFSKKIWMSTFYELSRFTSDIENPPLSTENQFLMIKEELQRKIALFTPTLSVPQPYLASLSLVEDLENYYLLQ